MKKVQLQTTSGANFPYNFSDNDSNALKTLSNEIPI